MAASNDKQQKVNGKALMADLTKGFKAKPTKRGGKSGFTLIQHDGRTLAMASIKNTGAVRLEGSRLDKNLTIIDAKGAVLGRKALEKVRDENASKAKPKAKAAPAKGKKVADEHALPAAEIKGAVIQEFKP